MNRNTTGSGLWGILMGGVIGPGGQKVRRFSVRANTVELQRDIGRNSLCPCGSGKKFKRCCRFRKV